MPTDNEINYGARYRALKRWDKDFLAQFYWNESQIIYPTLPELRRWKKDELIAAIIEADLDRLFSEHKEDS